MRQNLVVLVYFSTTKIKKMWLNSNYTKWKYKLTSSQSKLCCISHAVALIEDDEFDASFAHELLCGTKVLNFVSNHINTSIVRSIKLQCHIAVIWAVQLFCYGDHAGGLACSWWTIEQQMWKLFAVDESSDW